MLLTLNRLWVMFSRTEDLVCLSTCHNIGSLNLQTLKLIKRKGWSGMLVLAYSVMIRIWQLKLFRLAGC